MAMSMDKDNADLQRSLDSMNAGSMEGSQDFEKGLYGSGDMSGSGDMEQESADLANSLDKSVDSGQKKKGGKKSGKKGDGKKGKKKVRAYVLQLCLPSLLRCSDGPLPRNVGVFSVRVCVCPGPAKEAGKEEEGEEG